MPKLLKRPNCLVRTDRLTLIDDFWNIKESTFKNWFHDELDYDSRKIKNNHLSMIYMCTNNCVLSQFFLRLCQSTKYEKIRFKNINDLKILGPFCIFIHMRFQIPLQICLFRLFKGLLLIPVSMTCEHLQPTVSSS